MYEGQIWLFFAEDISRTEEEMFWVSGFWSPVVYFDSVGRDEDQMRNYVRKQNSTSKRIVDYLYL